MKRRLRKKCALCNAVVLKLSDHLIQVHKLARDHRMAILKTAKAEGPAKIMFKNWEKRLLNIDCAKPLKPNEIRAVQRLSKSTAPDDIHKLQMRIKEHAEALSNPDTFGTIIRYQVARDTNLSRPELSPTTSDSVHWTGHSN